MSTPPNRTTYTYTDTNGISKIINFVHPNTPHFRPEEPKLTTIPNSHSHSQSCENDEVYCNWKAVLIFIAGLLLIGVIICLVVGGQGN